jgi:hypothetical protein
MLAMTIHATSVACGRNGQVIDEIDLRIERNQLVPAQGESAAKSDQKSKRSPHKANHYSLYEETRRMDLDGRPIALRIPISRVLSVTTIVRVLTMLKAATITISSRITPIPSFSSLSA